MADDKNPNSTGYTPKPTSPMSTGEDFNGAWPADGFILPGTSTADQRAGRSQYVQGTNGRGNHGWKGSSK